MKKNIFLIQCQILALMLLVNLVTAQNQFLPGEKIEHKTFNKIPNYFLKDAQNPIRTNIINGTIYMDDDIVLADTADESIISAFNDSARSKLFSVSINENLVSNVRWPDGVIPFKILSGFSANEQKNIRIAMNHIMQETNVCFVERANETNYLRIRKVSEKELGFIGANSHLGMFPWGSQDLRISQSNFIPKLVIHELGHAIGLMHEHCRVDRDNYIWINFDNVEEYAKPDFWSLPLLSTDIGQYDFKSIMHYHAFAFSKNGKQTIVNKNDPADQSFGKGEWLSAGDKSGINKLYPKDAGCPQLPLSGDMLSRDELGLNKSVKVNVYANHLHNFADIYVSKGQKFKFTAESDDYWYNKSNTLFEVKANANGTSGDWGQGVSRHPSAKVMQLMGEIFKNNEDLLSYTGTFFKLDTNSTWEATTSGYIQLFANDQFPAGYVDNSGRITVTIKRIK